MPFSNNQNKNLGKLREQASRTNNLQGFLTAVKTLFLASSTVLLCLSAILSFAVGMKLMQIPKLDFLENYNPVQSINIFDSQDKLVASVASAEKRIIVPLSAVSREMKFALLAAEDHRFYEHKGVSLSSILRALLSNLTHGKVVEGGSTITQQLAKNLFFEGEKRTLDLKLAELLIAMNIENKFSKDKILELYLNEIYFGKSAYGIEEAARTYFGKAAKKLDLAESAFLAGIIRNPTKGGDRQNRAEAMIRQHEVIEKMRLYGFISENDKRNALEEWLNFHGSSVSIAAKPKIPRFPYYAGAVIDSLHGRYNSAAVERQGLNVYTNLDSTAQETAEKALAQGLARAPYGINQGALVSIRLSDGAVIALVGGVGSYEDNQWNCATNPHTVGSAFKPFVYLSAFERGMIEEDSIVEDSPLEIKTGNGKDYKPKNFDGKFMGGITVARAFAFSRNIPALRIGQSVGPDAVINTARRAGIKEELAPELALSLGCSAASPLHMANAYATLARGGVFMSPSLIRRVETRSGKTLESFSPESEVVFDRNAVAHVVDLMQDCVKWGTGQLASLKDRPVAGKTGTADQGKDLWFVGFTPDMVTAVWGGNRENKAVGGSVTGGTLMAKIWHDYESSYYKQVPTPAGIFQASNRRAAAPTPDRGVSKARSPLPVSPLPDAAPIRRSSVTSADGASAPRSATVLRSDSGVNEYSWSH